MFFTITSSFSNAQSCFTAKCKKYILPTAEHWQSFSFLGLDALMDGDRLLTLDEGVKEGLFTLVPPMGYFAKHLHRCFTPNYYYRLCFVFTFPVFNQFLGEEDDPIWLSSSLSTCSPYFTVGFNVHQWHHATVGRNFNVFNGPLAFIAVSWCNMTRWAMKEKMERLCIYVGYICTVYDILHPCTIVMICIFTSYVVDFLLMLW